MARTPPAPAPRASVLSPLFAPVDGSFLAVFRILFGAMMLWTVWELYDKDLIASLYINPPFHFTYHGFGWVTPWPGDGMYMHFAALGVLAVFLIAGFLTRLSALLRFLGFTSVFLLEKAVFLTHYYLMCLLCLLLAAVPAGRCWSVAELLRRRRAPTDVQQTVPAWSLWLLRFQIGLPYVYG